MGCRYLVWCTFWPFIIWDVLTGISSQQLGCWVRGSAGTSVQRNKVPASPHKMTYEGFLFCVYMPCTIGELETCQYEFEDVKMLGC